MLGSEGKSVSILEREAVIVGVRVVEVGVVGVGVVVVGVVGVGVVVVSVKVVGCTFNGVAVKISGLEGSILSSGVAVGPGNTVFRGVGPRGVCAPRRKFRRVGSLSETAFLRSHCARAAACAGVQWQ